MSVAPLWDELTERLLPVFTTYRSHLADLPVEVKADNTLLTEADVAVQRIIVDAIRATEPDAAIIAEEDERQGPREEVARAGGRVWVIDPIDGTAEFVQEKRVEFCSVVCLLEDWQPVSAFVLAPELGSGGTPIVVTGDARTRRLTLDGAVIEPPSDPREDRWLSATRSAGALPRDFDRAAEETGFLLKTRTTSQTLDMVRAAVDLSGRTAPSLPPFELFWRRRQKVWDGIAGLCLGAAAGLRHCAEDGEPLPLTPSFLSRAEPVFASTVMGRPDIVSWFLDSPH
ncbi:inositol monophosphatase family protein [Streptomyces sp. W16]|uniref:inositol monophosphatase family protein n=1 Tax=Streptomyces sp. W16 TaxID=3076631 RepID=UPI00295B3507|nr:inositol monophosphatase family protein [Streptomyces sp. W16]MDV9174083.1 inositol monophosphatase family protein [Streptomyces sp. W16]